MLDGQGEETECIEEDKKGLHQLTMLILCLYLVVQLANR